MRLRSGNPALSDRVFQGIPRAHGDEGVMSINGTVNKTGFLLLLVVMAAAFTWHNFNSSGGLSGLVGTLTWGGMIGGLALALVTVFKKEWSAVTAPLYAVCEGLMLGGISAMYNVQSQGIVFQAVALTFGVAATMLVVYKSRLIAVTQNFKIGLAAATGGIMLVYLVTMGLGFFGISIPYIHGSGAIGIGFSLFVVVIAALNLVMDFDFIEKGSRSGLPKYMEWYGAFGLIVTLIWLYLEILRLLGKLQRRN